MKTKLLIASLVVLACVAAPFASAAQYDGPGGPGAGGPVMLESELSGKAFVGGPGAAGPVLPSDVLGYEPAGGPSAGGPVLPSDILGYEPAGGPSAGGPVLPSEILGYEPAGGPGASGPVLSSATATSGGFDWPSAALGMTFALGLTLIAAGVVVRWRRRGGQAQPQH